MHDPNTFLHERRIALYDRATTLVVSAKSGKRCQMRIRCAFVLLTCCLSVPICSAEELAVDECKATLNLPEGTKVSVDGSDYGMRRMLSWTKLASDKIFVCKLGLNFPGGAKEERTLLVEGGRRLTLSASAPDALRPEVVLQTGHVDGVSDYVVSPTSQHVATRGGSDNTVILWDMTKGMALRRFPQQESIKGVDFAPDGTQLWIATEKQVRRYDIRSGRSWDAIPASPKEIRCFARSPDGSLIAAGDRKGVVRVCSAADGRVVNTLRLYPDSIAYECDSQYVAFVPGASRVVALIDAAETRKTAGFQELPPKQPRGATNEQTRADLAALDRYLKQSHDYYARRKEWHLLVVWDLATGTKSKSFDVSDFYVHDLLIAADGKYAICSVTDRKNEIHRSRVLLWDLQTLSQVASRELEPTLSLHGFGVYNGKAGCWLLERKEHSVLRRWASLPDLAISGESAEMEAKASPSVPQGLADSATNRFARVDAPGGEFALWSPQTGQRFAVHSVAQSVSPSLEFTDELNVTIAQSSDQVAIINGQTQDVVRTIYQKPTDRSIRWARFHTPTQRIIVNTSVERPNNARDEPEILIFDIQSGGAVGRFKTIASLRANELELSRDGRIALYPADDRAIAQSIETAVVVGTLKPTYRLGKTVTDNLVVSTLPGPDSNSAIVVVSFAKNSPSETASKSWGNPVTYLWNYSTG